MTTLYSDNFDNDTTGQLPSGWVNAVGTWAVGTANAASGKALVPQSAAALDAVIYSSVSVTDGTVTFDYKTVTDNKTAAQSSSISSIFRTDATYANGYLLNCNNGGTLQFYKKVSGNYSQIGTNAAVTMPVWTLGDVLRVEARFVGSTIEHRIWNVTTGGTRPSSPLASFTDTTFTSGYTGGLLNIGSGSPSPSMDNFSLADNSSGSATSYTLTGPSTATVGQASGNFQIAMNGTLGSAATFTPSDGGVGGTFTPSTVTIAAGSSTGTFTYTPSSAGSKTISTTNNASLTNPASVTLTASSASSGVTIARTNAAIYYSGGASGSFCDDGTSRMAHNLGSYVKFLFTGTSLGMTTTALANLSVYPQIRAIVDGIRSDFALSSATSYQIASGLSSGTHSLELYLRSSLYSAGSWWNLVNALKITGFTLDAGATISATTLHPNLLYSFGDSLTQAYLIDGAGSPGSDDATGNFVGSFAEAFNAEYTQVGHGGSNFASGGVSDTPAFNASYGLVANGYSRLSNGLFVTQPTHILLMLGTNGVPAQADVATAIANLRAAAPSAKIFIAVPPSGTGRAPITAATNAAIIGGDTATFLLDAGARYQVGLNAASAAVSGGTEAAPADGVHMGRRANARWGGEMIRQAQHYLEPRRFTVVAS